MWLYVQVKTSMYNPPELPCPGHILINVSAIGDDGVIYARTQSAGKLKRSLRMRHNMWNTRTAKMIYLR